MNTDQNWYRQLMALILVSASKAAVEFMTNPDSRDNATDQLRGAVANVDFDSLAQALTQAIDNAAATSKSNLNEAIDTLRDRGVEAVDTAKQKAEKQLGQKRGGWKMKLFFGLLIGAVAGYFVLDEQRRDELLDRLTGASGPIEQTFQHTAQSVTNTAQQATQQAANSVQQSADTIANDAQRASNQG